MSLYQCTPSGCMLNSYLVYSSISVGSEGCDGCSEADITPSQGGVKVDPLIT
jgi:hypothetical protein